jgi:peptidoglycan/xylan/chitin deacetylase (PgdA/CDA1 family)
VLDLLASAGARGVFFVCGANVEKYPELVNRCVREGHEVGVHTWSHPWLTQLNEAQVREELTRTLEVISSATGQRPRYFRPPYGSYSKSVIRVANELGLQMMWWSIDPYDWCTREPATIVDRVLRQLRHDSVVLLHDGCAETLKPKRLRHKNIVEERCHTVEALSRILSEIRTLYAGSASHHGPL